MNREKMRVQLSAENPLGSGYFYAEMELPATIPQIFDAMQRARFAGRDGQFTDVSILNAPYMEGLEDTRLDFTSIEELNFLAKRLEALPDEELFIYEALFQKRYGDYDEDQLVSVKDLINMTYGLDKIMIVSDIRTDEELGEFVIENGLHPDIEAIPDESLYLLDKRRIGELQRQCDDGIFWGGFYIVTSAYELPEVYDGEHLPDTEHMENAVFRLKIVDSNSDEPEDADVRAKWISLPMNLDRAEAFAKKEFGVPIEDCVSLDMESAIPHITINALDMRTDFETLNRIAERYTDMSDTEQIKFKAVLEAEGITDFNEMLKACDRLDEYEIERFAPDADAFFKDYLAHHLDTRFDTKWLDTLLTGNEGYHLIDRLGASVTEYGILSARGGSLYEIVSYDDPLAEIKRAPSDSDEGLDVIEVLGQTALFSNERIAPEDLPEGLYKYDLREGETLAFASVEPNVAVNHAGTIITKEPINFGEQGYIAFNDDTSPNFLGEHMSIEEFADADFSQDEDETQQIGGIQI